MKKQAISIVIDFKIYAYLFHPIVKKLVDRKIAVFIYTTSGIADFIKEIFEGEKLVEVIELDSIKRKHKTRFRIHRSLLILCTRKDFSFQFMKRREQITKQYKGIQGLMLRIAKYTPKIQNLKINVFLSNVMSIGLTNPFKTERVLVGSLNASAELLSAKDQKVYTVMESWDHAVKDPNGYTSDHIFAWNESLGVDWKKNQGEDNWSAMYPLKLRYAKNEVRKNNLWANRERLDRPLCVYAVASTRQFSINVLCDIENRIIKDLVIATEDAGWDLLIKPRPNGKIGEFDHFSNKNKHVSVGNIHKDTIKDPANYYLDDQYNSLRFREVLRADLVINAFTTFGLDAAAAGIPVLQIDLRESVDYKDSWLVYDNYHIKNHLLTRKGVLRFKGKKFSGAMTDYLTNSSGKEFVHRDDLYEWLFPKRSMNESIENMINILFKE